MGYMATTWRLVSCFTMEDSGLSSFQPTDNNASEPADQKMGDDDAEVGHVVPIGGQRLIVIQPALEPADTGGDDVEVGPVVPMEDRGLSSFSLH